LQFEVRIHFALPLAPLYNYSSLPAPLSYYVLPCHDPRAVEPTTHRMRRSSNSRPVRNRDRVGSKPKRTSASLRGVPVISLPLLPTLRAHPHTISQRMGHGHARTIQKSPPVPITRDSMIKSQARPREGAGTRGKSVIADEPVSHYYGRRGLVASNPQESVPALSICTVRDRARACGQQTGCRSRNGRM
jgi:hypothetical protein